MNSSAKLEYCQRIKLTRKDLWAKGLKVYRGWNRYKRYACKSERNYTGVARMCVCLSMAKALPHVPGIGPY